MVVVPLPVVVLLMLLVVCWAVVCGGGGVADVLIAGGTAAAMWRLVVGRLTSLVFARGMLTLGLLHWRQEHTTSTTTTRYPPTNPLPAGQAVASGRAGAGVDNSLS